MSEARFLIRLIRNRADCDAGAPRCQVLKGTDRCQVLNIASSSGGQVLNLASDADEKRLVVDAKEEITLRCGKASVTLTKAGKVMIQGTYVLHRSSGVMRIKGGSVQLN